MARAPWLAALLVAIACSDGGVGVTARRPVPIHFRDATHEAHIDFVHRSGRAARYWFCETVGSGVALFDYDNDGDLDLYLVQGHELRTMVKGADPIAHDSHDRLLRNESVERGKLRFRDVSKDSGIARMRGYGMGVAAGDFNNDGYTDLYVTNFGPNHLLINNGDGTFSDVTAEAGVDDPRWSTSAAFVDFDRDGWLDLYVCAYVNYSFATDKECFAATTERDYCGPSSYRALPDRLFRNRGDGTFEDVTATAGIATEYGPALGVVCADFDGDGWVDLYVANDGAANQLWRNRSDGTFENRAVLAGCAVNGVGSPEAGMGVDAGDFDGDGDPDLFMAHLNGETNTLYVNDGRGSFDDRTSRCGLGANSLPYTGFGTAFFDCDNDGRLDLFVVNGAVKRAGANAPPGTLYPPGQGNQLFRNVGEGRFLEVSRESGPAFAWQEVSRGAAVGDVDNDGDPDVVVMNNHGPTRLLLNVTGHMHTWLGLRLVGTSKGRDMFGARVAIFAEGAQEPLWRRARADGSYLSANDPRVLVGIPAKKPSRVQVHWPDGAVEEWRDVPANRYATLHQGLGQEVSK